MSQVSVLDIGCSAGNPAAESILEFIEDKRITRLDIDPAVAPEVLHDITLPLPEDLQGKFDIVVAAHVLEHIRRADVTQVLRNIVTAVREMGEVWILVPSLEWASDQIRVGRDNEVVQRVVFGNQDDPYQFNHCGFTLNALRTHAEVCGMLVRKAYQSPRVMTLYDKQWTTVQNVVIGMRLPEPKEDPAEAIE